MNSSFELIPKPLFHYHDKKAVCIYLRISSATLNRWIRNGDFPPPHKIGQIIVGWPSELIRYRASKNQR
ncbi:TPA: AlpA family phage regulatory protein [Morganella morganii]|nr:AlpA family phage regulatory protein [Morganella morganii]EKW7747713.1 AlpA family phage regulatory protein [Morganella morganii]HCR3199143.1 AlpA family phage regulatory protein [Morganella morganii]HCT8187548.1 AlpA family phage regulatory protein [Morganella morganii]